MKLLTVYQTDVPNMLGGFMTYGNLSEAMSAVNRDWRASCVVCVTFANAEWWNGKKMPFLTQVVSSGVVYRKKGAWYEHV